MTPKDDPNALADCPFCGGEGRPAPEKVSWAVDPMWAIMCPACGGRGGLSHTEAEAIAAWNTRAALRAKAGVVRDFVLADFTPGAVYFPDSDCLDYYEADETAITVELPSGGASVQWNADRTEIIGVSIYGVRAALADQPAARIEALKAEIAEVREAIRHAVQCGGCPACNTTFAAILSRGDERG